MNTIKTCYTAGKKVKYIVLYFAALFLMVGGISAQQGGVGVSDQYDNATYLSQSTPGVMVPGQIYGVSVSMKNTGRSVWNAGNYTLKLTSVTDAAAYTWGISSVSVNSSVSPGDDVVFNFNVTAPVDGSYNYQWQMANGNAYFGEPSTNVAVRVSGTEIIEIPGVIENNAAFVTQNMKSEMEAGLTYDVSVTMRNTGSTTWETGDFKLKVTTTGADNTLNAWTVANVELSYDITPGSDVTFLFKVTAPIKEGVYNLQCQLVRNDVFFGQPTTNVVVNVD
jgi:hypothetical protein